MVSNIDVKPGDKVVAINDIFGCLHIGEEFVVTDVSKHLVDMSSTKCNEDKVISLTHNTFKNCFKVLNENNMKRTDKNVNKSVFQNKAEVNAKKEVFEDNVKHDSADEEKFVDNEDEAPSVTLYDVFSILEASEISVETVYDRCTVVTCKLPNGFIIVETSASASKENYNEETGVDICMKRIRDKVWELETYRLMANMHDDGFVMYDEAEELDCASCDSKFACEESPFHTECAYCINRFTCKDSPFYYAN